MRHITLMMSVFVLLMLIAAWGVRINRPIVRSQIHSVATGWRINLNTASADTLALLPRVGPRTAQEIVQYRHRMGRFANLEDLTAVPRIGVTTIARIKPWASCGSSISVADPDQLAAAQVEIGSETSAASPATSPPSPVAKKEWH